MNPLLVAALAAAGLVGAGLLFAGSAEASEGDEDSSGDPSGGWSGGSGTMTRPDVRSMTRQQILDFLSLSAPEAVVAFGFEAQALQDRQEAVERSRARETQMDSNNVQYFGLTRAELGAAIRAGRTVRSLDKSTTIYPTLAAAQQAHPGQPRERFVQPTPFAGGWVFIAPR